jgi:hypothetical protein
MPLGYCNAARGKRDTWIHQKAVVGLYSLEVIRRLRELAHARGCHPVTNT